MGSEITILLMFLIFVIGLLSGFPLAFVMGAVGVGFGIIEWGWLSFDMFAMQISGVMNSTILLAIPLFILMANLLSESGISERLFSATPYLFGPLNGGLGVSVTFLSMLLAACTGIIGASVSTMGLTAMPVMLKARYDKHLTLGIIASGGCLGILIPPSIMLVVMGPYASLSVGTLFAAAIIPGALLGILYMIYTLVICWIYPNRGPALSEEERQAYPLKQVVKLVVTNILPTLILILGVLGSIFFGIATVTEAAAVGAFTTFLMVIFYGQYSWVKMKKIVLATAKTSTMVLTALCGAACFTVTLFGLGGKKIISGAILNFNLGSWELIILIIGIVFILGMFMDWVQVVPVSFPIFLPLATRAGFDPVWFTVLIALALQTAFLTPPVGAALFYLKGVSPKEVSMADIIRGIWPFTGMILLTVIICCIFPGLISWLPSVVVK